MSKYNKVQRDAARALKQNPKISLGKMKGVVNRATREDFKSVQYSVAERTIYTKKQLDKMPFINFCIIAESLGIVSTEESDD